MSTKKIYSAIAICIATVQLNAQDFKQTFDEGGDLKLYISRSKDATSQNKLFSLVTLDNLKAEVIDKKLRFTRNASSSDNAGSWVIGGTSSPFSPAPVVAEVSMEFEIKDNTTANQSMFLAIGTNIGDPPLPSANQNTHSSFAIKSTHIPGKFIVNNGTVVQAFKGKAAGPYSGKVVLKWIINNSGSEHTYAGPDGAQAVIANDCWNLYIDDKLVQENQSAITPGIENLTAVKFAFKNNEKGTITVDMDNISIKKLK